MRGFEKVFQNWEDINEIQKNSDPEKSPEETQKKIDAINVDSQKLMKQKSTAEFIMKEAYRENELRENIDKLIKENNIDLDKTVLEKEIIGDSRYIHIMVEYGQNKEKGFLKILKPITDKDSEIEHTNAFIREITTNKLLIKHDIPALSTKATNIHENEISCDNPNPNNVSYYAIIETLPKDVEIGFIGDELDEEKKYEKIKLLQEKHAERCIEIMIDTLEKTNSEKISISQEIHDPQDHFDDYEGYLENTRKIFSTFEFDDDNDEKYENYVTPTDINEIQKRMKEKYPEKFLILKKEVDEGKIDDDKVPFWMVLEYRLENTTGRSIDFRKNLEQIFSKYRSIMEKYDGETEYITHGDLAPNNLYVKNDNDIIFIDREWTGISKNKFLAMIYDYGNLRARSWNNEEFRNGLDRSIMERLDDKEAAQAVIDLGILRSHALLAGFMENYDKEKQLDSEQKERKESTEKDLLKIFKEI